MRARERQKNGRQNRRVGPVGYYFWYLIYLNFHYFIMCLRMRMQTLGDIKQYSYYFENCYTIREIYGLFFYNFMAEI